MTKEDKLEMTKEDKFERKIMKKCFIILAIAMTACSPKNTVPAGNRDVLAEGWTLSREGATETFAAQAPSTVAGTLADAGYFGEGLLEARNYEKVDKAIFDDPWTYSTVFAGKPGKGQHVELVFDGLDYYADIFLNGKQLASADTTFGVFIRRKYDVTGLLKGRNKLEVKLRRAQKGDLNIGFVDWNPRPLDESMGHGRRVHRGRVRRPQPGYGKLQDGRPLRARASA